MKAMWIALCALSAAARAESMEEEKHPPYTWYGATLGIGGGVSNFAASEARQYAGVGGRWEVRAAVGTRLHAGVEAAYVGSVHGFNAPGVERGATLLNHGVEGALRVHHQFLRGAWLVEPFAFGGLGWSHLHVSGAVSGSSPVHATDNVMVVPLGAGISLVHEGLLFEGRFTWRQTFNETLVTTADGSSAKLNSWALGVLLGYEF